MDQTSSPAGNVSVDAAIEQQRRALVSRLVLLGLAAPLIGLGVVLWLLLPGGVAGYAYAPSQYSQAVQIQPATWQSRVVSVTGYLDRLCAGRQAVPHCSAWILLDQSRRSPVTAQEAVALGGLQVLPQHDSALYTFVQRFLPGLGRPFPQGLVPGDRVTVTGTIQVVRAVDGLSVFAPKAR